MLGRRRGALLPEGAYTGSRLAPGGELGADGSAPREARALEAAIRTRDVATLAQKLFEVEEQLVSKKIAERLAAKSATLAALERLEKARKELDEASRQLLTALNLQGSATDSL